MFALIGCGTRLVPRMRLFGQIAIVTAMALYGLWLPAVAWGEDEPAEFAKWEDEISQIQRAQREKPAAPGGVVFTGSSSVRLWDLAKSFPGKHYVNSGFGGSQIRECTHFAPRLIVPHQPKAILFYAGDNDVAAGRSAAQVRDDFVQFVATVRQTQSKCQILFIAIKPSRARWQQRDEQARANTLIAKLCETDPQLVFIDVATPMLASDDGKPRRELFVADGLHLSDIGYQLWTKLVADALAKISLQ